MDKRDLLDRLAANGDERLLLGRVWDKYEQCRRRNIPVVTGFLSPAEQELVRRLNRGKDLPHEIGLFLGYPAEDVSGFIRHGARCAKCVGTWKVYGDEESARKKFALYQKCTRLYCEAYRKHNNLDRLLVRTHGS